MLLSALLWMIAVVLLGLSIPIAPWYRLWLGELVGAGYVWWASLTLLLLVSLLVFKLPVRRRRLLITLAIALGFYASSLLVWYVPRLQDSQTGGMPLSVMTYNVNYRLWQTEAVTKSVRSHPSDVLGLVEPLEEDAAALRDAVQDLYPYYYRATAGGLSLFSRYPIVEATTKNLGTRYHSLFATLDVQGVALNLVLAHPLAPISRSSFWQRNRTIAALAKYASQQELTTIVMGDFNATSWAIPIRNFLKTSKLRSVALGHGLYPTWFYNESDRSPSRLEKLERNLKIPIDHIFVSQNVSVDQVMTPPAGVSDHRPLLVKVRIR